MLVFFWFAYTYESRDLLGMYLGEGCRFVWILSLQSRLMWVRVRVSGSESGDVDRYVGTTGNDVEDHHNWPNSEPQPQSKTWSKRKNRKSCLKWRKALVFFVIMASICPQHEVWYTSGSPHGWWISTFDENARPKLRCLIYLAVIPDDSANFFLRASSLVLMGTMSLS